jgi:small-conductance mechanosensitive channel
VADSEELTVEKIDVLTTTFRRLNGKKVIRANHLLARESIENHKRSAPATFIVKLNLSYNTTAEKIDKLKRHMEEYLRTHSKQWRPELSMTVYSHPGPENLLSVNLWVHQHQGWQDTFSVWASHGQFLFHAIQFLKELNVTYELPPQPVRLVGDGHALAAGANGLIRQRRGQTY